MRTSFLFSLTAFILCCSLFSQNAQAQRSKKPPAKPTVGEARAFLDSAEKKLKNLWIKTSRASWIQSNFITDDTDALAADAQKEVTAATVDFAKAAARFNSLKLPYDLERQLNLLKLSLSLPGPGNPAEQEEMTQISVSLESDYGKGKFFPDGPQGKVVDLNQASRILATSRNADTLLRMWKGWHSISPPMRDRYTRLVELSNKGAKELGYRDLGAMWRSNYDLPPDQFAAEIERLWQQVKPLYEALHAHVRASLTKHYGESLVPKDGLIPAHLLGNMWAQQWNNIYELVAPPSGDMGYDLTEILKSKKIDEVEMVRIGERFFVSLGFDPLPETFWKRSLFKKPADRDVVCHASAWSIDFHDDLRIKMCIEINDEDFSTIHHELGHNFYQRAYNPLPLLYQGSANDGFHEALGDAVALSITPEYLQQLGFIQNVPDASGDLGLLMKLALDKVAFLPFGLLIDQWRWKVFSDEIKPSEYNTTWWQLREKYQGVKAPVARSENDFDPGAKYHVPASVPYTRYFLAAILQFQFHRALAREAGIQGPLHRASVYNNKKAGEKLRKMMAMGQSRSWPEALEALTGEKKLDATAFLDYFAPLKKWLDEQNKGRKVGY
ncbi:MAG: M2 family metallopeptidase [Ignavibacteriales bacterium]|nr:M2 family metallopeptidase [Ignavibacteriales bacterium]